MPVLPLPCLFCSSAKETAIHMHEGCAHSRLLWPHYRQAVQQAARHLPPGDKALLVASWRSTRAAWTEIICSRLVPGAPQAQPCTIARYKPPGDASVNEFLQHRLPLGDFAWELRKQRLQQLLCAPHSVAVQVHQWLTATEGDSPPPPLPSAWSMARWSAPCWTVATPTWTYPRVSQDTFAAHYSRGGSLGATP